MQALRKSALSVVFLAVVVVSSSLWLIGCQPASSTKVSKEALLAQAEAHLESGDVYKALRELQQVLSQDPNNSQVHVDLGWVYLYTDDLDKALAQLNKASQLDLNNPDLHYLRGAIYHRTGQWVDALEEYNHALKTDINNPQLHADIAEVFLLLNNPDGALKEFDVASRLDKDNGDYVFGECRSYRQLKRYDQAILACRQALQLTNEPQAREKIQEVAHTIELLQSLESAR